MCLYTSVYGVFVLVQTKNEMIQSHVDFYEHFGTGENIFEGNVTQPQCPHSRQCPQFLLLSVAYLMCPVWAM